MRHILTDDENSEFTFGDITAELRFSGDLDKPKSCDVQDWQFTYRHPTHGDIDLTEAFDALEDATPDNSIIDRFREMHCAEVRRSGRYGRD